MKELKSCKEINDSHVNKYLQFEGHGIMNGLCSPYKYGLYKLVRIDKDKIIIKSYRAKNNLCLPDYRYDQKVRVFNKSEFSKMPIYS